MIIETVVLSCLMSSVIGIIIGSVVNDTPKRRALIVGSILTIVLLLILKGNYPFNLAALIGVCTVITITSYRATIVFRYGR